MSRIQRAHYIWGLFDQQSQKKLQVLHRKCNARLKGSEFIQHITLSGPILKDNFYYNKTDHLLDHFCNKLESTSLGINSLICGDSKFMSLYISLENDESLKNMIKLIEKKLCISIEDFDPHISLYYGLRSTDEKESLTNDICISDLSIKLNRVAYVEVDESVDLWRVISSRSLP